MPITKIAGKKREGKQAYRVRVNYTDALNNYKQRERTVYGLEEAKAAERELISESKEIGTGGGLTIQELFEEYVKVKTYEVRENTLHKFRDSLRLYVLPALGDVKLSKLTLPTLQKWKTGLEETNLSTRSKQNAYATLRTLLNYAVKMDYMAKNPLERLGNFKETTILKSKIDFYTADEFLSFIKFAREEAERKGGTEWSYYTFFCLAFYTGMRKGEINALRWSDIDGSYIHIQRSVTQKLKGGDRITPPKNKSSIRTIQIPAPLKAVLNEHKERCKVLYGYHEDWYICGTETTLRDTSIENRNIKYAKAAGLKKIRIHDFRHSHASLLANEGINIQEVARRLGHSKVEITWNTYSHLYPREEERAIEILDKIGDFSGITKEKSLETQ